MTEAAKNPGPGPVPAPDAVEDAPADASAEAGAGPVDQKAAFKAALDRKLATNHGGTQHLDGDKHVSGSSHAAASRRQFRRKSG